MIPNLVKGRGVSGAVRYCMGEGNDPETKQRIKLEPGQTSRSRILGGQGFGFAIRTAEHVELARRMMEYQGLERNQTSKTRKCEDDCLHISLSWEPSERPNDAEMLDAAESLLAALGMADAKALFFIHTDKGPHIHVVASRIRSDGKTYSAANDFYIAQAWAIQWEILNDRVSPARALTHRLAKAVREQDIGAIIEHLTDKNPTFTGKELAKVISYGGLSDADAAMLKARILASRSIIGLHEMKEATATAYPSRFTTRAIIEQERAVLVSADQLARLGRFEVSADRLDTAAAKYTLSREQRDALDHASDGRGFAMIAGEAGTGKSQTAKAIREAALADGFTVKGLAWTNKVVGDMRKDGFEAATIAAELDLFNRRPQGNRACDKWDHQTILIVDEAAQLSTATLEKLLRQAQEKGAKVILIGDDKQFASIERGGMFTTLRAEHDAAEIKEVRRNPDREQQEAWSLMHEGEFRPALAIFDRQGALKWSNSQDGAEKALMADYAAAVAGEPDKDRFIFAATNAEVKRLNEAARQLAKDSGQLGEQTVLAATKAGPLEIATGDRLQMNVTGSKAEKANGIVKDAVGTVTALETGKDGKPIVTVQFDAEKGEQPKVAQFAIGEDRAVGEINDFSRGYAGTSYKGQGRSVEDVYVLHSEQWRASTSYVSLTRHKETVGLYAARETVATAAAWTKEAGGLDQLKGKDRIDAEKAFAAWTEKHPDKAERMAFAGYVDYVQGKQAQLDGATQDRDQLAKLMGRDDMKRAAMGYTIDPVSYERSGLAAADRGETPAKATERAAEQSAAAKAPIQPAANQNAPEADIAATATYQARETVDRDLGDAFAGVGRMVTGWAKDISEGISESFASLFSPEPPPPPSPEDLARTKAVQQEEITAADRSAASLADRQRDEDGRREHLNRLAALFGREIRETENEHDLEQEEHEQEREIDRGR